LVITGFYAYGKAGSTSFRFSFTFFDAKLLLLLLLLIQLLSTEFPFISL